MIPSLKVQNVLLGLLPSLLGYTCISHLKSLISLTALTLGGSNRSLSARGSKFPQRLFSFFVANLRAEISA